MINEIGDWVFRQAAQLTRHLRLNGHPAFQIGVNKSPVQFHSDRDSFGAWLEYLQQLELPGSSISVEITEGLLLDSDVTDRLLAMRDSGVQVALDDFGTGYSSLSYLKKYDIDYLKIDRSFVRDMTQDQDDQILCEAIIVMAHKLGLKVIAEGVETMQQRDLLFAMGCDYGQGYLFSRPIPALELERLLA
jgi:EAL domain-containing protein (putative c-di-GMP-specific phosphodiesterase class I)